jgi:hypothetical protein
MSRPNEPALEHGARSENASVAHSPPDSITVFGEFQGSVVLRPTPELSGVLDLAALISRDTSRAFNYSFSALILAFAYGRPEVSKWFKDYINRSGADLGAMIGAADLQGGEQAVLDLAGQQNDPGDLYQGGRRTATASSLAWLEQAKRFSEEQQHRRVGLRHFVGALVFSPQFHAEDLQRWRFDRPNLAHEYLSFVAAKLPADLGFWQAVDRRVFPHGETPPPHAQATEKRTAPQAWVDSDAMPVIGDLAEFKPSQHDSLDAAIQAKIFATLIVAEDVRPPFALGLLGDWGVGKTFFMRLMQETVASIAGKAAHSELGSRSVSRAAQIEFNAWHFVDSDLWASLASHVFDGLAVDLRGPGETVEDVRRRLRSSIQSSKRGQEEAAAAIKTAQTVRQTAAKALEQAQEERVRAAANCESHRLKRVWEAVLSIKPDKTKPDQSDWPDVGELKNKAESAARRLGLTSGIESAKEVQRVYDLLRQLSHRGAGLAAALASAFSGKQLWISTGVVLAALALVLSWPWILDQILAWLGHAGTPREGPFALWLQLTTVVGGVATWAGRKLTTISSAMGYLEKVQQELRQPRVELPQALKEEEALRATLESADARIATEQRRIEEADHQIADAQAEIQRLNAGGVVYDFLDGRVRDSRYLDRLGLISVIRQDFEKLGTLLRDWRKHGSQAPQADREARPIERIILYIDDLDRCPPQRVVEVLQAVHLILAFDLFVVVVAVDARWLERSLNEAYNPPAVGAPTSRSQEPMHRFSAQNYLEKIFQIPFSLPAMDEAGYRKLVVDMLATPRLQVQATETADSDGQKSASESARPTSSLAGRPEEKPPTQESASEAGGKKEPSSDRAPMGQPFDTQRERAEAAQRIEAMKLEEYEEQFIKAVFRFIQTPRLAKRFVNIYRLVRVRAAASEASFSAFIHRDQGDYRAVLTLLAIVVGRAQMGPEILDNLDTAKGSGFRAWLREQASQYEQERARLSAERAAQGKDAVAGGATDARDLRAAELSDACREVDRSIDAVIAALHELRGPSFDDRLSSYATWASQVLRFSFRRGLELDVRPTSSREPPQH